MGMTPNGGLIFKKKKGMTPGWSFL
jgi:hypothetical protein